MFQEKDIEVYQNTKAPVELKNRIWLSVEQQRKRAKKRHMSIVVAAACFALVFSLSGVFDSNSAILSIDGRVVSYDAVNLQTSASRGVATAREGQNVDTLFFVPLEIDVTEETKVTVTKGTLSQMGTEDSSEEITEMDISESTVIYWCVNGDTESTPMCTITTGEESFNYVIEFDEEESVFIIKQTK